MGILLKLFLTVSLMFVVTPAQALDLGDILKGLGKIAGAGKGDRGRHGRGGYECRAYDKGHEEHWGGHDDCHECLGKHGNCVEICTDSYYVCTAQGQDHRGRWKEITAQGPRRWRVEDRALRRCDRIYSSCQVVRCDSEREEVSRQTCYGRRRR